MSSESSFKTPPAPHAAFSRVSNCATSLPPTPNRSLHSPIFHDCDFQLPGESFVATAERGPALAQEAAHDSPHRLQSGGRSHFVPANNPTARRHFPESWSGQVGQNEKEQ